MKQTLISVIVGAALCVSSIAYAATAPLAPGGAAGIKEAQSWTRIPVWGYVGGVLVIIGFVTVLTGDKKGGASATTTTPTH